MANHLKRLAAPKTWPIARKANTFTAKPKPSGQKLSMTLSLSFVFKDLLKLARTTKEVKFILKNKEVLVNGTKVHDDKYGVGFMDVISIPALNTSFRITINDTGKLAVEESGKDPVRLCKVANKIVSKGKKEVVCLHDGTVLKAPGKVSVGDTVAVDMSKKITSVVELKKGAKILLTGGSHIGVKGAIQNIIQSKMNDDLVEVKTDSLTFKTSKKYAFVIGDDKELI